MKNQNGHLSHHPQTHDNTTTKTNIAPTLTAEDRKVTMVMPDLDQAKETACRVVADPLHALIEHFERLAIEKQEVADHKKEVMAEAKSRGYDTKTLHKIVALCKKDPQKSSEEQAVLDLYCEALGMWK